MAFFSDLLKKWFYTKNSSAASSDARVPLLDASGNPKGSDTMANLASVLGGLNLFIHHTQVEQGDCNTILYNKSYYAEYGVQATNLPTSGHWFVFTLVSKDVPGYYTQYALSWATKPVTMYMRTKDGSWTAWSQISTDIPSFYKNYADIVSLTSGVKRTMKVSQKSIVVPASGLNNELGLQANPFIILKADTSNFNGCMVLLCDHSNFTVLGNYGGFNDWVTLSASEGNLVIQNKTGVQLTLPVFTFVG